jgi:2-polyprenyl-3-methyl-5-hydroxy-6-metoxy-1,4-benzoquinol methylase
MYIDKRSRSGAWDISYRKAGAGRLWPPDPTIQSLDLAAWKTAGVRTVLDAGCGDGKNLVYLVQQGFMVVGADASRTALEKCRYHLQDQELDRNYLLLSPTPLDKLPVLDESFDAAICVDVLGHLEEPLPILHEVRRVIRQGGPLYASVFHLDDQCREGPRMRRLSDTEYFYQPSGTSDAEYYFRFYGEQQARTLFESSGFNLKSIRSHRWKEPPHVGYRDEWHEHESWFALLQKPSSSKSK